MQYKEHHNHTTGNIKTAFWLNLFFTILAFVGGYIMNSNAIKAESVHNLGCTFTIGSAWFFQWLSEKKQFKSFSFGMGRIPLIGAIISAIVIFTSSILIITESIGAIEIHHSHGDIVAEGCYRRVVVRATPLAKQVRKAIDQHSRARACAIIKE